MTELLVGTKKGLFVLRGGAGAPFEIATRAFPGDVVEYASRDPRTGQYFASVTCGLLRPAGHVHRRPQRRMGAVEGTGSPRTSPTRAIDRVWIVQPGEADACCTRASPRRRSSSAPTRARPGN